MTIYFNKATKKQWVNATEQCGELIVHHSKETGRLMPVQKIYRLDMSHAKVISKLNSITQVLAYAEANQISPTENTDSEVTAPVQSGVVASEGEALSEVEEVLIKFPFVMRASEAKTPNNSYYPSYPKRPLDDDIPPAFWRA